MESNLKEIQEAFASRAEHYDDYQRDMFKIAFTQNMIENLQLTGQDRVLEVAAGTCAMGRMMAPMVKEVTELDITEEMLKTGEAKNLEAGIQNVVYVVANAEQMPFEDETFDAVCTRLSFHHFRNPVPILSEMMRVLRPGGKVGIIDMVPPQEERRELFDETEWLRDHSHVHCFTAEELEEMLTRNGLTVIRTAREIIPMNLKKWLGLMGADSDAYRKIMDRVRQEMSDSRSTVSPYMEEGEILFPRHWVQVIARK